MIQVMGVKTIEKVKNLHIVEDSNELGEVVTQEFLNIFNFKNPNFVPAAGSSHLIIYEHIRKAVEKYKINCSHLSIIGLDELYPIMAYNPHSFEYFMRRTLLNTLIDHGLREENIIFPNPFQYNLNQNSLDIFILSIENQAEEIAKYAEWYESHIKDKGIDLAFVGYGRSGIDDHTNGFNFAPQDVDDVFDLARSKEGINPDSRTRLVYLPDSTKRINNHLDDWRDSWQYAVTMGNGTIGLADKVIGIITGDGKTGTAKNIVEDEFDENNPMHVQRESLGDKLHLYVHGAAQSLAINEKPWLFNGYDKDYSFQAIHIITRDNNLKINEVSEENLKNIGFLNGKTLEKVVSNAKSHLNNIMVEDLSYLGDNLKILVNSSHPDDGVLSFFGPIIYLASNMKVYEVAALNGSDAVRFDGDKNNADVVNIAHAIMDENLRAEDRYVQSIIDRISEELSHDGLRNYIEERKNIPFHSKSIPLIEPYHSIAQITRYFELMGEVEVINSSFNFKHPVEGIWADLPYYQSSEILKLSYGSEDVDRFKQIIKETGYPEIIAIADEPDPNGNHRKSNLALLDAVSQTKNYNPVILGYCGSWIGKRIYEADLVFPVTKEVWGIQQKAAWKHLSQMNEPKYPGASELPFIERAKINLENVRKDIEALGIVDENIFGYVPVSIIKDTQNLFKR